MESKLITKTEIRTLGFSDKQTTTIWRDVKKLLKNDGYEIYGQRTEQIPREYVMRYLGLTGVSGERRSRSPDQVDSGGLRPPSVPACQVNHKENVI